MSNLIPPLLSSTPPPIGAIDDDDDEFGDFTTAVEHSYVCDPLSIPNTPHDTPNKLPNRDVDINSNSSADKIVTKDYQDKRKCETSNDMGCPPMEELTTATPHNDLPNSLTMPSTFTNDDIVSYLKTDEAETVPEVDSQLVENFANHVTSEQIVPSHLKNSGSRVVECDDVYREEPPEIIPEDPDDDFGHFEFNSVLRMQNETKDDYDVVEIPVVYDTDQTRNEYMDYTIHTNHVGEENISEKFHKINKEHGSTTLLNKEKHDQIQKSETEIQDTSCPSGKNSRKASITSKLEISVNDQMIHEFNYINSAIPNEDEIECELNIADKKLDKLSEASNSKYTNDECTINGLTDNASFADFQSNDAKPPEVDDDDEFGDFVTPTIESAAPQKSSTFVNELTAGEYISDNGSSVAFEATFPSFETSKKDGDDFGDFDDYVPSNSSTNVSPSIVFLNSNDAHDMAETVVKEMFTIIDEQTGNCRLYDFTVDDIVFKEMKDITDTNALTYQWSKSQTQKGLLKALNIDTRNILYGPGLNSSMPKFAANLGLTPLEPVRSEVNILTPAHLTTPSTTSQAGSVNINSSEVPTAKFDWKESGLANPLDSVSKDENQNCCQEEVNPNESELECDVEQNPCCYPESFDLEDNTSTVTQTNPNTITQSPVLPSIKNCDNESVNSLQFADIPLEEDLVKPSEEDEFSDFTSFQSNDKPKEVTTWSNSMVLLRETYINNIETKKFEVNDEPGWLKPTILTPVLPRKNSIIKYELEEDEFTDFQMSFPPDNNLSSLTVLPISNSMEKIAQNETVDTKQIKTNQDNVKVSGDDKLSNSIVPSAAVVFTNFGILQPVQVFTKTDHQNKATDLSAINWPDPGITEEELMRFEMYSKKCEDVKTPDEIVQKCHSQIERKLSGNTGSMLVEKSVVIPANKVVLSSKEIILPPNNKVVISKDLVLPILDSSPRKYIPLKNSQMKNDDDDWTDFISNQEPVKIISKMQQRTSERTSTPELPLSIPQLSHIQPPKLPIPVITPQGLMQTKIPSMPVMQPKPTQLPLHLNPPQDGYQPSIISHQFAMQMNQNSFTGLLQNNSYQTTSIPANMKTPTHQPHMIQNTNNIVINGVKSVPNTVSTDDNDEWSDFVSSRPSVAPVSNGLPSPISPEWSRSTQFNSWNPVSSPNVIANPPQYKNIPAPLNKRVVNGIAQSSKSNIPSISSLPDLDFVAPKSRTFNKK